MSEILSNEAVAELEKRIDSFPLSPHQARALCATVKHLREQLQEEQNRNQLQADSIMDCEAEITTLQSQLEQLRAENERLTQERDAAKGLLGKNLHGQIEGVFGDQQHGIDGFRKRAISTFRERAREWGWLGLSNTWFAGKEEAANELAEELEKL